MNKVNKCKCGSTDILVCSDRTVYPYKHWVECIRCGFVGGIIYTEQKYGTRTVFQDGTEIIRSPEKESIDLWNQEVSNTD